MLIAVTQRVEVVAAYGETRDCLDQNWSALLSSIDCNILPVPNIGDAAVEWLGQFNIDGLILSGGNDLTCLPNGNNSSNMRDLTERLLLDHAADSDIPVLGVCRGMQHVFSYLGGALQPVNDHVAQRHTLQEISAEWTQLIAPEVNSFHDWGIGRDKMPDCLAPLAVSPDNTVEAFKHKSLPWLGIMWHPERESPWAASDQAMLLDHFKRGV